MSDGDTAFLTPHGEHQYFTRGAHTPDTMGSSLCRSPWHYELQNTSLLRSLRIPFTAGGGSSSTGVVLWPAFSSLFCFFYGVFKPTFTNDSYSQCFLNWSYFQSSQTLTSEKSTFSLIPLLTTLQTDQCWHLL